MVVTRSVLPSVPTLDQAKDALRQADGGKAFWHAYARELLAKYPDQFVAVHKGEIIATNSNLRQLIRDVKVKGLNPGQVWVRFLASNPERRLL